MTSTLLNMTQGVRAVTNDSFKHIPPAHRVRAFFQTLAGAGIGVGALFLPKLGFPWQAALAVAAFGGWIASKKMVKGFVVFVPRALAAIVRALQGKSNGIENGETNGDSGV